MNSHCFKKLFKFRIKSRRSAGCSDKFVALFAMPSWHWVEPGPLYVKTTCSTLLLLIEQNYHVEVFWLHFIVFEDRFNCTSKQIVHSYQADCTLALVMFALMLEGLRGIGNSFWKANINGRSDQTHKCSSFEDFWNLHSTRASECLQTWFFETAGYLCLHSRYLLW